MTAYDLDPADLALEREDDRDERAVQARKEGLLAAAERRNAGRARGGLVVAAAGLDPVAASLTAMRTALDAAAVACGLPVGAPPSVVEFRAARDRDLAAAVVAWREVDRFEYDTPAWWDAMYRLRDAADQYAGLGIGQTGGAA